MAIALKIIYPVPDRSDQTINHVKNEYGEIDVGWAEGLMSDGRPFRMEMWAQDGISMLTFFFSASGLADLDDEKMAALVLAEGFVSFRDGAKQFIEKVLRDDPAGNATWSASIVVGDEDETFISGSMPVFSYSSSSEPRSVFNPSYLVKQ